MSYIKRFFLFISDLLGFKKNSSYVKSYINDANVKSSIYMSFIVIVLELWMIIRNTNTYIIPGWAAAPNKFDLIYKLAGPYVLFLICATAVLVFAISYFKKKNYKGFFIANIVLSALCILYPLLLVKEKLDFNTEKTIVNSITTLLIYCSLPLLGAAILTNTLYKNKLNKNHTVLSMLVIILFATVCLLFGVKVGYSDFANPLYKGDSPNFDRLKMITCFLTMTIFVACLLIWKPYISIILLTSIFVIFLRLLKGYHGREFLEPDEINYITFLISITMVAISIYQQRVAEARKDEKLMYDAKYDRLVNLYNQDYLCELYEEKCHIDSSFYSKANFLFINLSQFRMINDQRGVDEGDKLLIKFSEVLKEVFTNDLIARQADDHFVVIIDNEAYLEKINQLNDKLKELVGNLFILLKVGVYKPQENESPYTAIDKARYACGIIKRKPEELYSIYGDNIDKEFKKKQYIINNLDEAIKNDWIQAYYQPVVWSVNKELCGAEALARWIDPEYGFLSPAEFIPLLEENRLIHKLDAAIIVYVCKKMREAMDNNRPVVPISINFSRLDFELMDVEKILEENITKYNIDKKLIHIEITESALSGNVSLMREKILSLKNKGYAIWLDDFGSGYSSLNVLKDFTFDVIKIDMTFLSNFETNEKTKDILDSIIQLANKLGVKTLTEGVETIEESEFLKDIGCQRLQGYLFGKPFKLDDFEEKIEKKQFIVSENIL